MKDGQGDKLTPAQVEGVETAATSRTDRPQSAKDGHLPDQQGAPPAEGPSGSGTSQRVGQPGAQDEHRNGPSPLSDHPTGPHAPYDANDPGGLAAAKHGRASDAGQPETPADAGSVERRISDNISVLGEDR